MEAVLFHGRHIKDRREQSTKESNKTAAGLSSFCEIVIGQAFISRSIEYQQKVFEIFIFEHL